MKHQFPGRTRFLPWPRPHSVFRSARIRFGFLIFGLSAGATAAPAAVYYVDTANSSASDNNPGTATSPWKTFNKPNNTLVAGDTVVIKAGVYNTFVSPRNSGTPSSPITYQTFGTDVVTVQNTT